MNEYIRPHIPGTEPIEREILSIRNAGMVQAGKCVHACKCGCQKWVTPQADPNTSHWQDRWYRDKDGRWAFR